MGGWVRSLNRGLKKVLIEDLVNLQAIDFREWSSDLLRMVNIQEGCLFILELKKMMEQFQVIDIIGKDSATVANLSESNDVPTPDSNRWKRLTNLDSGTLSTYASEEANFQTNIVRNGVISWALERLGNDMGYEQEGWNEFYDVVDSGIDLAESLINLFRASFSIDLFVGEEQCLVRLENGHAVVMAADDAKGMNVMENLV